MAALTTLRRSTPAFSIIFAAIASGIRPTSCCAALPIRRAVRLHPDRVDHRVGAAAVGQPAQRVADVVLVGGVEHLDPVRPRADDPLRDEVDADHAGALVLGDARAHVADRAEAEHRDRPALRDVRVLDRLPRGRQHVGEVEEAIVARPLGHLDRAVLGLRHAQELGLPAGDLAVELRVAEQRGAHALVRDLGGLALGLQAVVAHEARAAGDVERDHHAIALGDVGDLGADLLDDAHRLVAEDVALAHERAEDLVEVEVGAADAGRRDADDRVGRVLDARIGDGVDADVALPMPGDSFHALALPSPRGGES